MTNYLPDIHGVTGAQQIHKVLWNFLKITTMFGKECYEEDLNCLFSPTWEAVKVDTRAIFNRVLEQHQIEHNEPSLCK